MSRSKQENEEIVQQFRGWLARTTEEIEALDATDSARADKVTLEAPGETPEEKTARPAPFKDSIADEAPANSTAYAYGPDAWTEEVTRFDETIRLDRTTDAGQPDDGSNEPDESAAPLPEVGLRQLVEAFTAMRHETKLQTKSTRGLADAVQSSLSSLDEVMRQFQGAAHLQEKAAREKESAGWASEEAAVPLIEAIVELDEALQRGARAFEVTTQTTPERLEEMLDAMFQELPRRRRWTARLWQQQVRSQCIKTMDRIGVDNIAHLKEGYRLIQGRFERVLRQHDVRRIESVGRHVDPEEMNVVELIDAPNAEPETVVEEVRPGYKWRDRVIRFAEVRAARGHREMATDDEYCHNNEWHSGRTVESNPREGDADFRPVRRGRE